MRNVCIFKEAAKAIFKHLIVHTFFTHVTFKPIFTFKTMPELKLTLFIETVVWTSCAVFAIKSDVTACFTSTERHVYSHSIETGRLQCNTPKRINSCLPAICISQILM